MYSYSTEQNTILAATSKTVTWLFETSGLYWSTKAYTYGIQAYTAKVLPDSFGGVTLNRAKSELGIQTPNEIEFVISNPARALDEDDFKTAGEFNSITIRLILSGGGEEEEFGAWTFRIKSISDLHYELKFYCEDYLTELLEGQWPNTPLISSLSPSSDASPNDKLCVPVPFGTAYIPLRSVYITDRRYYVLGLAGPTFTISEVQSPHEFDGRSTWSSGSYSFTQSTQAINGIDYRVFQALIHDPGTGSMQNGLWRSGDRFLDPLVKFTRSDLSSITDFADALEWILEDFGVPSAMIDAATFAAAKAAYATIGLTFNYGFFQPEEKTKIIASILNACNSTLIFTDTIELHVFDRTNRKTLDTSDIAKDTFKEVSISNINDYDSGYVAFPEANKPQDKLIKALVPADGTNMDKPSSEIFDIYYYTDTQDAQRAAELYYQRKFWGDKKFSFKAKLDHLNLQPDDVITVNHARYGGSNQGVIDSIQIDKSGMPTITILRFKDTWEDWSDHVPGAITIAQDDSSHVYTPVATGGYSDGDYPATVQNLNAEAWLRGAKFSWSPNYADDFDYFEYRFQLSDAGQTTYSSWGSWTEADGAQAFRFLSDSEIATYGEDAYVYIEVRSVNTSAVSSLITVDSEIQIDGLTNQPGVSDVFNNRTENSVTNIPRPGGGTFSGGAGETGVIKIQLPQSWTSTMVKFIVDVYVYETGKSFSLEVGGNNRLSTTSWYYTTANLFGSIDSDNRVRFGHDGTYCCIYIGETTSTWSYPKVTIRDFQAGNSNYDINDWEDGWVISIAGSVGTITADHSDALIDAAAIKNQGALATVSAADWATQVSGTGKPADNATVGATWDSNVTDQPSDNDILNNRTENSVTIIPMPVGGTFNGGSSETGVIKIQLPQSWNHSMIKFTVDVYNYENYKSFSLEIAGYLYLTTPTSYWTRATANLFGSIAADNRVRFGHDGTYCCVYIGETDSIWRHPKIIVRNVQVGYLNYDLEDWQDGWAVSIESSVGTITVDFSDALIDAAAIKNQGALAVLSTVDTDQIDALAVTTAKIDALAVTNAKIGLLAVDTAQLNALAVTEAKIGALAVTNAKIGLLAVDTAQINALAITEAKIGALAVTEAKIGALAVTEAKIGALAVTNAKINDLSAAKINAGYLSADRIEAGTIALSKLVGTSGTLTISSSGKIVIDAAGGLEVEDGADITMKSTALDKSVLKWAVDGQNINITCDYTYGQLNVYPDTAASSLCAIGYENYSTVKQFSQFKVMASSTIDLQTYHADYSLMQNRLQMYRTGSTSVSNYLTAKHSSSGGDYTEIRQYADATYSRTQIAARRDTSETQLTLYRSDSSNYIEIQTDTFRSTGSKTTDMGAAATAFDDVYADDFNNVADFYFLDYRNENDQIKKIDDLAVLNGIKPSGEFNPVNGLPIINDNTMPEFLWAKSKKDKSNLIDPDGKPYFSLKTMISLCMGAIRQLDQKVEGIKNGR